jgi:chaperonin cofactor prefoldin
MNDNNLAAVLEALGTRIRELETMNFCQEREIERLKEQLQKATKDYSATIGTVTHVI